jgi:hypothetical protein
VTGKPLRLAPLLATCFALLWGAGQGVVAGSTGDGYERILARFNSAAPPAYRAYRKMEAGLLDSDKRGWMEVWTTYSPGQGLRYEVVKEGGSDYVRHKILFDFLDNEKELIARGQPMRAAITARNYEVENAGATADGLQRISLKAARKSDGLINGTLFLHPEGGYVTRMQGRLVKSPSFWVRDVDVTWKFGRIGRHVMPVEMSSTARVRMFGRSDFRMVYEYVSIDGQPTGSAVVAERE